MEYQAAKRVAEIGTSPFTELGALFLKYRPVDLFAGFPDFPPPDWILETISRAVQEGYHQYMISPGWGKLRQAIAAKVQRFGLPAYDPDAEITVTVGAVEGILAAVLACVDPGDEVIVFDPSFDAYVPDILLAGATPRLVPLHPPEWRWDPDELAAAFTKKTRAAILNTPHNPTGRVFTAEELEQLAALCREHNTLVITDEVYEHLVFDDCKHISIATLPEMRERTIVVSSTAKTFGVTGWKIGYTLAPAPITAAIRKVHQYATYCAASPCQAAIAMALEQADEAYYTQLAEDYQKRRDFLISALEQVGIRPYVPEGTFFILADVSALGFEHAVALAQYLLTQVGVAALPAPSLYNRPGMGMQEMRFCFAKRWETLQAAAERLSKLSPNQ